MGINEEIFYITSLAKGIHGKLRNELENVNKIRSEIEELKNKIQQQGIKIDKESENPVAEMMERGNGAEFSSDDIRAVYPQVHVCSKYSDVRHIKTMFNTIDTDRIDFILGRFYNDEKFFKLKKILVGYKFTEGTMSLLFREPIAGTVILFGYK